MKISIAIGENVATGRAIAAARMMLGLDQAALAVLANVSPATISNAERGHGVRDDTLHTILSAVRRRGATITIDRNGYASIAINFHESPTTQRAPRTTNWKQLSFEQAAALGLGYLTAWSAIVTAGRASPDDFVLMLGATGAVGPAALKIANALRESALIWRRTKRRTLARNRRA
jgi:transcriptional regulator with XRE-family HTH domain